MRPFPSEQVFRVITEEFGRPPSELFAEFDPTPQAAGSLAQVHRAKSHDGRALAVKVRRPDAVREVERDLSLMSELALLVQRHIPEAEIFDPVGLVNHFARTIRRELNFSREARSIEEFSRLFRNDATIAIPKVDWELSTEAVLTMGFIDGCRIDDREALGPFMSTRSIWPNAGARIFIEMAFEIGLFHGDPHPGNLRVLPDGRIGVLDYGMVGVLEDEQRELLVDLFLAVTHRNVNRTVDLLQVLGQPFGPIDAPLLRADVPISSRTTTASRWNDSKSAECSPISSTSCSSTAFAARPT